MKHLLLALVVLIGASVMLLWRARGIPVQALPFLAAHREAPRAAAPAPVSRTARKSAPVVRAAGTVSGAAPVLEQPWQPESSQPEERIPSATTARPPVAVARPPIPVPDKIALGLEAHVVTGKYGYPSAWAIAEEDGHIIETLVYAQERGGSATVIRIVDGRVAAAYTKVAPASPRGSLIREFSLRN